MSSNAGEGTPEERRAPDLADETPAKAGNLAEVTAARALRLAGDLSGTLTEIARRLDEYSAFGQRSRKIITTLRRISWALAVSLALDIALTVVLGLTAFQAHYTAATNGQLVQGLHAEQLSSCANGNTFRSDQDTVWKDFIDIIATPSPGESAAQVAKTDKLAVQFLTYVATVNHPINCASLYGT